MFKINRLQQKDIPQVIKTSLDVFKPKKGKKDSYHNKEKWEKYFKNNGIILGAFVGTVLAGYLFAYKREKDKRNIHVWMAGVKKEFRRKGIFKSLISELGDYAKKQNFKKLTVNTYPNKFKAMFVYLTKNSFKKYKEEFKEWNGSKQLKAFFKKDL